MWAYLRSHYRQWQAQCAVRRQQADARWNLEVEQYLIDRWRQRFWWRMAPTGGWSPGYDCAFLPWEAQQHIQRFGGIVPPTRAEIFADFRQIAHHRHLHLLEADQNVHLSLSKHAPVRRSLLCCQVAS